MSTYVQVADIESLVTAGKRCGGCPYFASRKLLETAEVIVCPYNYAVDPDIRESMKLPIQVRQPHLKPNSDVVACIVSASHGSLLRCVVCCLGKRCHHASLLSCKCWRS